MGGLGCILFTIFLLIMSYSGIASAIRDENGNFKKDLNFKSVLGGLLFSFFLLGILVLANINYSYTLPNTHGFIELLINSFGVFLVIHIYDLLILDYLIVVKWHPKFLKLPNTDYYTTITPHIKGFLKGLPLGIIASVLASIITLWIM